MCIKIRDACSSLPIVCERLHLTSAHPRTHDLFRSSIKSNDSGPASIDRRACLKIRHSGATHPSSRQQRSRQDAAPCTWSSISCCDTSSNHLSSRDSAVHRVRQALHDGEGIEHTHRTAAQGLVRAILCHRVPRSQLISLKLVDSVFLLTYCTSY